MTRTLDENVEVTLVSLASVLGKRIKSIREDQEISQVAIASQAGLNQSTVSQVESGIRSPNLRTILKLAEVLDYDVSMYLTPRHGFTNLSEVQTKLAKELQSADTYKQVDKILIDYLMSKGYDISKNVVVTEKPETDTEAIKEYT